jgi:CO/xanthine dehydrogenase Mo-binding subunit
MAETSKEYRYIGKAVERKDGVEKVSGSARFTHDLVLQGMLYAKTVRSPYAYARIKAVDTGEAEKMPGVRAVVTGKELAYKVGLYVLDKDILAKDFARYHGEAVAAVAAESELAAEQACAKIKVDWELLEPVLDPKEALKEDAPRVHPELGSYGYMKGVFFPKAGTNIPHQQKIRKGDMEKGFGEAELVVENSFYNSM